MRILVAGVGLVLISAAVGCSEDPPSSPVQPSMLPPEAQSSVRPWSLTGRVVSMQDAEAVDNVELSGAGQSTTTQPDGSFLLQGTEASAGSTYLLEASKPGFLTHEVWVRWSEGERDPVELSLIRDQAPFSLAFYRQFVRNGKERADELQPSRRWSWGPPNFYIKTNTGLGFQVSDEDREHVTQLIRELVPVLTGGVYAAGRIESGAEDRNELNWITIEIAYMEDPICGRAYVGANPGRI